MNEQLTRREALVAALAATTLGSGALLRPCGRACRHGHRAYRRDPAALEIGRLGRGQQRAEDRAAVGRLGQRPRRRRRPAASSSRSTTTGCDPSAASQSRRCARSTHDQLLRHPRRLGLGRRAGRDRARRTPRCPDVRELRVVRRTSRRPTIPRSCASARTTTCCRTRSRRSSRSAATGTWRSSPTTPRSARASVGRSGQRRRSPASTCARTTFKRDTHDLRRALKALLAAKPASPTRS